MTSAATIAGKPTQRQDWLAALSSLPDYKGEGDVIPAFFFPHGHPGWVSRDQPSRFGVDGSPQGRPATFLKDFGRFLLDKYKPQAILVFSAHWETQSVRGVSNWGAQNPILYDYYGFPDYMYKEIGFISQGDDQISADVAKAFKEAGMRAKLVGLNEPPSDHGLDRHGIDHGVFVPFSIMFPGHEPGDKSTFDIPVVQASIDSSLTAEDNEALGRAVRHLRSQGILVLSGGLTVHTFRDFSAFSEETAKPIFKEWDQAVVDAVNKPTNAADRRQALRDLMKHPGCKLAHPRADHFVPIYVAAGAGSDEGEATVISGLYGCTGIAFT